MQQCRSFQLPVGSPTCRPNCWALYGRRSATSSKATIWRVVTGADAAAVDAVIGAWLAGQVGARQREDNPAELGAMMVDGKTVRLRHEVARGE